MKKYAWNYDEFADEWRNGTHDTIEECIEDAINNPDEIWDHNQSRYVDAEVVYIGEVVEFIPRVDSERILEHMQEDAGDFCGSVGYDWEAYDYKKPNELKELDEKLTVIVHEWLKKYNYWPEIYAIENIKEYKLNDK